ncbi:MAG: repeat-like domain, partial [Actinomycetota bacterium]|nr:repeat-like domain [Actinomycetota bacterium]
MRNRFTISTIFVLILSTLPFTTSSVTAVASPRTVTDGGLTFEHSNIVDPFRLISEPNIAVDSKGAVYTSGPGGSAAQSSTFWKSDDNGIQYHPIGIAGEAKQNSVLGGGDTEYALAKDDTVYASDQEFLLCNATFRSKDGGNTFGTGEACLPGTDRPWMGVYDPTGTPTGRRVYFAANQSALLTAASLGCYLNVSTDDGVTYLPANGGTGVVGGSCKGHMAIDQTNGWIYLPTDQGVKRSTDGGKTFTNLGFPIQAPGQSISYTLFANLATDSVGNLYYVYSTTRAPSSSRLGPIMLAMLPKGSTTWSTPVPVNTPDLKENVFPWVVAGDTGRVAVMYVSTTDTAFNTSGPGLGGPNAEWHVYVAISTDAISCAPTCAANPAPTFQQAQADDHTMHKGTICVGGFPGCLEGQADRSMADFFVTTIDPRDGRVFLVWDDNADRDPVNNIGKSYVTIARQRTGPSLFADEGDLLPPTMEGDVSMGQPSVNGDSVTVTGATGLPPGNYSTDPAGDAVYPVSPVEGPNVPALDIKEASVSEDGANYKFTMKVA